MNNKYEKLFNFLGCWFPDMDLEGLTEKDIVKNYKQIIDKRNLSVVIAQAEEVKNKIEDYWEVIREETNVYFEDHNEALLWLDSIINLLKENDS